MTTLGVMKRLVTTIAVVLGLVGCGPSGGSLGPSGGSLLTGDPTGGKFDCFLAEGGGLLVFDPSYGTAIIGEGGTVDGLTIVAWRPGYTARPNGSEFDVLDPQGRVAATTGQRYLLHGGYVDAGDVGRSDLKMVWWTCEDPEPLS
jgi:hypothetical protein